MTPEVEEWRAVVGYEGAYEVSSHGRIRSLDRTVADAPYRTRFVPGKMKVLALDGHYPKTTLSRDGKTRTFNVHALVARAFLGPVPDGMEVCHNNGEAHDNRLENLRYDTRKANAADRREHGMHWPLNRTHCPSGHPYTPDNTGISYKRDRDRPGRYCRTCHRERDLARTARKRAAWRGELGPDLSAQAGRDDVCG